MQGDKLDTGAKTSHNEKQKYTICDNIIYLKKLR